MATVINVLTFLIVSLFVGWQIFERFSHKPIKKPLQKTEEVTPFKYSLTLKGDLNLYKLFLNKNIYCSYSEGKIFLFLKSKKEVEGVVKLYLKYTNNNKVKEQAKFTVAQLIKTDIAYTQSKLSEAQKDYKDLYNLLKDRGIPVSFKVFKEDIKIFQRKTFNEISQFWDSKFRQLLSNFNSTVEEPDISLSSLMDKASSYFGNDLKLRLFKLYLKKLYYETRLEADLFKYKQYES
jgi:hypothetical protein